MSARACACVCAFFQSNGSKGMSRLGARCLFDSLYLPADCQHTHTRTHTHSNVSIQAFSLLNVRQDQLLTCWDVSHVFTPSLPENTDRPDHIKKKSSSPLLCHRTEDTQRLDLCSLTAGYCLQAGSAAACTQRQQEDWPLNTLKHWLLCRTAHG